MAHYESVETYTAARVLRRKQAQARYLATIAGREAKRRAAAKYKGKSARARRLRAKLAADQRAFIDAQRAAVGLPPFVPFEDLGL